MWMWVIKGEGEGGGAEREEGGREGEGDRMGEMTDTGGREEGRGRRGKGGGGSEHKTHSAKLVVELQVAVCDQRVLYVRETR